MITNFNNKIYKLSGQMNAILLNTVDAANSDDKLKVYIPKLMPNISSGEPKVSILTTNGYSVFMNAEKNPALTNASILQEKNYFETDLNATSNIDDMKINSFILIREMNQTLKEFASVNNLKSVQRYKNLAYILNKGTELRVEFLNSKLDKLAFTTMDKTKSTKELR